MWPPSGWRDPWEPARHIRGVVARADRPHALPRRPGSRRLSRADLVHVILSWIVVTQPMVSSATFALLSGISGGAGQPLGALEKVCTGSFSPVDFSLPRRFRHSRGGDAQRPQLDPLESDLNGNTQVELALPASQPLTRRGPERLPFPRRRARTGARRGRARCAGCDVVDEGPGALCREGELA